LVQEGQLDDVGQGDRLRITRVSVDRRLAAAHLAGKPLSPNSAWAVLALASGDGAFRTHVGSRLSDPDRSRARGRLQRHRLQALLPRLRGRAIVRRIAVGAEALVDLLADGRLVLAGTSAARALGWLLPGGDWPVDAYLAECDLIATRSIQSRPARCGCAAFPSRGRSLRTLAWRRRWLPQSTWWTVGSHLRSRTLDEFGCVSWSRASTHPGSAGRIGHVRCDR
jgi:hypothetical protein